MSLLTRETGIPASKRLGVKDPAVALDLDRAVLLAGMRYDNDKDRANRKFWVALVAGSEEAERAFPDDEDEELADAPPPPKVAAQGKTFTVERI